MTPYHVLAKAAKRNPDQSFLEVWNDFACWERARAFRDDPNAASKEDIEWIESLYDLSVRLREREGNTQDCRNALEAAAAAFAAIPHEPQLHEGITRWHQQRLDDQDETSEETQIHTGAIDESRCRS